MNVIPPPIAWGVFVTAVIVSRILQERALARLSTEAKGRLVEAFSAYRMVGLIPLAVIAAMYFLMTSLDGFTVQLMLALYLPAVLVFTVVMQVFIHRKLTAQNLDPAYVRTYSICRGIMLVAFALLMLSM